MKRVLMVAYHFPPLAGSSGIQRTLRFVQHLPSLGWQPLVLTAQPQAYEWTSDDLNSEVAPGTVVRRAFALDAARQLSLRGRYIAATARPDRWVSWRFDGVRQGLRLIREFKPQALWSTYPIATAHLIGARLHQRTGLPWIADFRDPMAQQGYPEDVKTRQQFVQIEQHALLNAAVSTFTTPSAAADYRARYPTAADRIQVLENGYDEASFSGDAIAAAPPLNPGAVTLLHSGIVYSSERDPTQLMAALSSLSDAGRIVPGQLVLRFRAAVAEGLLHRLAVEYGVEPYVQIAPALPYREALCEMQRADGLLVMQASNCNAQIPAKLYEYLRAGRPILCLSDPVGDTADLMRRAGIDTVAPLDSVDAITQILPRFIDQVRVGLAPIAAPTFIANASRRGRSRQLATLLERSLA